MWAGPEYGRESTTPLYILLVGILFQVLSRVAKEIVKAYGRTDLFPKYVSAELVPYLAMVVPMTIHFGSIGAATAWTVRFVVECQLFFRAARRLSGVRFRAFPDTKGMVVARSWPCSPRCC